MLYPFLLPSLTRASRLNHSSSFPLKIRSWLLYIWVIDSEDDIGIVFHRPRTRRFDAIDCFP